MQSQLPLSSKHAHLGDPLVSYLAGPDFGSSFRRRLNPKQFSNGWTGEVARYIPPAQQWSCKRFLVWCPFGIEDDGSIRLDAYQRAKAQTPFITQNFIEAWKPVTQQGCEVIFYIGSLHSLKGLSPKAVLDRIDESLHPYLAAGGSVAFDASSDVAPESPEWLALEHLTSRGIRWYVEAWPAITCKNLRSANWCCDNNFFRTVKGQLDTHQAQGAWATPLNELAGECIRIATIAPPELKNESGTPWTWTAKVVPRVVAEGQSIAFYLNLLIERGITRGRLALEAGAMLRGQK